MFLYTLIHLFIYLFFFFSLAPSVFYCQFFPHLNNSPYSLDWALCWFLDFSVCPSYFYPSQNAGLFTPGWFFFSGGFDHGRAVNDLVPCPRSIYFACEFPIFRTPVSLADFSMCLCVAWESFCLVVSSSAFFFSAGLLNSFSILQFVPRLGCASTVRFVVCSICIRFRSVTGTGSLVRDTLSPYLHSVSVSVFNSLQR